MPFMDRDSFITLLNRLGDADDAGCLAAAREIHQRMQAADLKWSDLLLPMGGQDDEDADEAAVDGEPLDRAAQPITEDFALIDRLLARSDLSQDMRDELTGMREDIGSGEFTARDRRYLQSLDARLSRPS